MAAASTANNAATAQVVLDQYIPHPILHISIKRATGLLLKIYKLNSLFFIFIYSSFRLVLDLGKYMLCNLNILYIAICSNYMQGMFKNRLHSFVSLSPNAAIGQASAGSSCTSDYILVRKSQRYF